MEETKSRRDVSRVAVLSSWGIPIGMGKMGMRESLRGGGGVAADQEFDLDKSLVLWLGKPIGQVHEEIK